MLNRIKNSLLCKCLLVLMTGYFLISSITISRSLLPTINDSTSLQSIEGMAGNFFKKVFQCEGIAEELEEFGAKECKTLKLAKGLALQDYLLPMDASWFRMQFQIEATPRNYKENPVFKFDFHGTIQVPPPRIMA